LVGGPDAGRQGKGQEYPFGYGGVSKWIWPTDNFGLRILDLGFGVLLDAQGFEQALEIRPLQPQGLGRVDERLAGWKTAPHRAKFRSLTAGIRCLKFGQWRW
jgi:hypothetical protein